MKIKLRQAKLEDRKQVLKLVRYMYSKSSPKTVREWKKNYAKLTKLTFVAEAERKIVAYITCGVEPREPDSLYIGDLYVLPKHRGKGVATSLIGVAEKLRNAMNKKYIRVDVRKKDKPAFALYNKLGFKFWKPKSENSLKLRK